MTTYAYSNLSTSNETGISPEMPCTLMMFADGEGGWRAPKNQRDYGSKGYIRIEVKKDNGLYQEFEQLEWQEDTVTVLDIPNATIRVTASRCSSVGVEIIDSASA